MAGTTPKWGWTSATWTSGDPCPEFFRRHLEQLGLEAGLVDQLAGIITRWRAEAAVEAGAPTAAEQRKALEVLADQAGRLLDRVQTLDTYSTARLAEAYLDGCHTAAEGERAAEAWAGLPAVLRLLEARAAAAAREAAGEARPGRNGGGRRRRETFAAEILGAMEAAGHTVSRYREGVPAAVLSGALIVAGVNEQSDGDPDPLPLIGAYLGQP